MRSDRRMALILGIAIVVLISGISYSFYTSTIDNSNHHTQDIDTASMTLTYTDCADSNSSDCSNISAQLSPGEYITKAFKVENTGTLSADYNLEFKEINSTFVNSELRYSLETIDGTPLIVDGTIKYGNSNNIYIYSDSLAAGDSKEYKLTIKFFDNYYGNSESNVGATFSIKLGITTEDHRESDQGAVATFKNRVSAHSTMSTNTITLDPPSNGSCTNTLAYDGTKDNNLRYVGANPCNYATIGGQTFRIIGIMNDMDDGSGNKVSMLKLIRRDSIGSYGWNSSLSSVNNGYGINEWNQADIMNVLNSGPYWTGIPGYCPQGVNKGRIACDFSSKYMQDSGKNLISDVVWNLGATSGTISYISGGTAAALYNTERGTDTGKACSGGNLCNDTEERFNTWLGKVGLLYPSDYAFATSGGSTVSRESCLTEHPLGYYAESGWNKSENSDCKNNDWLYSNYSQWTLTAHRASNSSTYVLNVDRVGSIDNGNSYAPMAIRPVIYLKPNAVIASGDGSSSNKYTFQLTS